MVYNNHMSKVLEGKPMDPNYGGDIISITDEDGVSYNLEHLDTIEINGVYYLAFVPADLSEDDDSYGILLLKKDVNDDDLTNLTDEEEDMVYDKFMARLFGDDEDEETDEEE
jgi:hypothetical protein